MNTDEFVYHYTDAGALSGIILNQELWAADFGYMNDSNEGKVALNIIDNVLKGLYRIPLTDYCRQCLDTFLKTKHRVFLCSFSKRPDNLSLYRTYCPPKGGYSLGFQKEVLMNLENLNFVECCYDRKEQESWVLDFVKRFKEICDQVESDHQNPRKSSQYIIENTGLHQELSDASVRFKPSDFHTEEEVRLYFKGVPSKDVSVRIAGEGSLVIPYTKIKFNEKIIKLKLHAGPNANQDMAFQGMQSLIPLARASGSKWEFLVGGGLSSYRAI